VNQKILVKNAMAQQDYSLVKEHVVQALVTIKFQLLNHGLD
jgi:hypothetical protein